MKSLTYAVGLVAALAAAPVMAQGVSTTTGAIQGVVSDTTKAVVPGVTVTLSGPAVMGAPVAVSDEKGFYRFSTLQPGSYTLVFTLPGFSTITHEGIAVSLGFTATVNVEMSPAT